MRYLEIADLKLTLLQGDLPDDFDLVAISSFSAQIDEAYALADRFRSRGTMVVLGGLHVTSMPDEAQQHCDAVVVGEGEPHWLQLLEDAQSGVLKPRYDFIVPEFKLVDAPMPAFELLDISQL